MKMKVATMAESRRMPKRALGCSRVVSRVDRVAGRRMKRRNDHRHDADDDRHIGNVREQSVYIAEQAGVIEQV